MDLRLGHHAKDGDEIIDVKAKSTRIPRRGLRELRIDLVSTGSYQLVLNLGRVPRLRRPRGTGRGPEAVRAHDGSLDLVCTQQRILKILKITGLTEVFGIYETADQAIAASKGRR